MPKNVHSVEALGDEICELAAHIAAAEVLFRKNGSAEPHPTSAAAVG